MSLCSRCYTYKSTNFLQESIHSRIYAEKQFMYFWEEINHKGCWTCLWEGDWKQRCLSQLETKVLDATGQVLLQFTAQRSTDYHQAGDWKLLSMVHGAAKSIHFKSRSMETGPWAEAELRIVLVVVHGSRMCLPVYHVVLTSHQSINQPSHQTPKQQKMYKKCITRHDVTIPLQLKDTIILWLGMSITHLWSLTDETYLTNLQVYFWSPVHLAWRKNGERAVLTTN